MKKTGIGVLLVVLATLCWGTISLFSIPLSDMGFNSIDKVFVRTAVSAIIIGLFMLIKDRSLFKIRLKDLPIFILTGGIGNLLTMFCYMISIEYNGSSLSATLMYTSSVWVVIFSALLFKEKITLQKIVCLIGVIVGCVLFALGGDVTVSLVGIVIGLLTGLCYSTYSIGSRLGKRRYSSLTVVFYAFVFSAAFSIPFVNYGVFAQSFSTNPQSILYSLFIAIVCSAAPYLLYVSALKFLSTGTASILATLEIVFATVVGVIFYPQFNNLGVFGVVGLSMVIVFLAVLEIPISKIRKRKEKE